MAEVARVKPVSHSRLALVAGNQAKALQSVEQSRVRTCPVAQHLLEGLQEITELVQLGQVIAEVITERPIIVNRRAPKLLEFDAFCREQVESAAGKKRVAVEQVIQL